MTIRKKPTITHTPSVMRGVAHHRWPGLMRGPRDGLPEISYLVPSCDGCGLAWSFGDPACADGIPPHFADRAAALEQLPAGYDWQVTPRRIGRPLMACRRCAAARVIPATAGRRWLLAAAGWARRLLPSGPLRRPVPTALAPGHPESMTAALPPDQEGLLAVIDAEIFPDS